MTTDERDNLLELLDNAAEKLNEAIDDFRLLARAARQAGDLRLAGEIESYTLGNLEAFADNDEDSNQMGSVGSIADSINGGDNDGDED